MKDNLRSENEKYEIMWLSSVKSNTEKISMPMITYATNDCIWSK